MDTENQTTETHCHEVTLITGTITNISSFGQGKLSKIDISNFPNKNIYYYDGTLEPSQLQIGQTAVFGKIHFQLSDKFYEPAYEGDSDDNWLIFDVSEDECLEGNITTDAGPVFTRNFIAAPSGDIRLAGTKACAPCKFIVDGQMIHYDYNDYSYYPMVTFPDEENNIQECYLSYFKCETQYAAQALQSFSPTHIFGFDDLPEIDSKTSVLVHENIAQ